MDFLRIIIYILSLGGSILCFVNYKKLSRGFFLLGLYLAFAGLTQLIGYILAINSLNNIEYYNITIILYTIIIFLIFNEFALEKRTKNWLRIVFLVGLIPIFYTVFKGISTETFSIKAIMISSMVVVLGVLISLYGKIKNPMHSAPLKMGWLWLFMGFLFYYSSTFSYWVAYRFATQIFNKTSLNIINVILIIVFYLILLTAITVQLKYGELNEKPIDRKRRFQKG